VAEDLDAVSATDDREHDAEADLPPAAEDLDAVSATDDREHDAEADLPPAAEDLDAVSVSGDWEQDLEVDLPPVAAELDAVSVSGEQSEAPEAEQACPPADAGNTCGTSLNLPDGTVRDLWNGIISDHDLSDNERFLTCVSVLLSETRSLLRAGAISPNPPASS
jgi:hypothetical protein